MGMRGYTKGLIVSSLVVGLLSGCRDAPRDNIHIVEYVNDIEHVMNIRYAGYNSNDEKIIDRLFISEDSAEISEKLESAYKAKSGFISLEDTFKKLENDEIVEEADGGGFITTKLNTGNTDERIKRNDVGERGIYLEDVYIDDDGQFCVEILGNVIYVDVTEDIKRSLYIGNPSYKLKVLSYNYYDDGTFIVTLGTDIDGAFKERFSGVEIVEDGNADELSGDMYGIKPGEHLKVTQETYNNMYNSFVYENESYELKVSFKINKDGKVVDLNKEHIIGSLSGE